MFVMILLGIAVGIVVNNVFSEWNRFALSAIRILILPLVVGIGYEFIMFAGKHDNVVTLRPRPMDAETHNEGAHR